MSHRMSGIETRLYVRKSADHPIRITVEREPIPRGGYILHFVTAGEGSDVTIWLSQEHAQEVMRTLSAALAETEDLHDKGLSDE